MLKNGEKKLGFAGLWCFHVYIEEEDREREKHEMKLEKPYYCDITIIKLIIF